MVDSQTTAYNMPGIFEIKGNVDIERVQYAFQSLINRHETLRTRFETIDGETIQVIEDNTQIRVDYEEKSKIDYDVLSEDFVKPFNLTQAPLLRVKVVKCDEQRYILLFDIHHIISDGVSINNIIKEFLKLYQGHTLEKMKLQYKDYSEWIKNRDLSKQRTFWLSQFEDKLPVLDLPLDYLRPKQQTFESKTIAVNMPNETKIAINRLAQTTGSTDYTILLTSLMILLHKYTHQEDIVIGSPVSGRTHKNTEEVIGAFFNRLAMRGYPEGNKSFNQLLSEIKRLSLKALDNQDYPIEKLKDEVMEKHGLTRNTLHDVAFAFQNFNNQSFKIDGWEIEEKEVSDTNVKFDLHMIIEGDEAYKVSLKYANELFDPITIQRMLNKFIDILDSVTKDPEQKISEIEISNKEEKRDRDNETQV